MNKKLVSAQFIQIYYAHNAPTYFFSSQFRYERKQWMGFAVQSSRLLLPLLQRLGFTLFTTHPPAGSVAFFIPVKSKGLVQCCGSGSVGSVCFWISWIWIQIFLSSSKNSKKNLDSYCFVTFFDFLSSKNDVNVPSESNKLKKLVVCWPLEGQWRKQQDPDPDPLVRGMVPRIRIHTNMSWIRNTGWGHNATLFVCSIFSYITYLLVDIYDEAGGWWFVMETCVEQVVFHDVMANFLGSGGLHITVSSSIDPFPPWDSNLRPTHQRL